MALQQLIAKVHSVYSLYQNSCSSPTTSFCSRPADWSRNSLMEVVWFTCLGWFCSVRDIQIMWQCIDQYLYPFMEILIKFRQMSSFKREKKKRHTNLVNFTSLLLRWNTQKHCLITAVIRNMPAFTDVAKWWSWLAPFTEVANWCDEVGVRAVCTYSLYHTACLIASIPCHMSCGHAVSWLSFRSLSV